MHRVEYRFPWLNWIELYIQRDRISLYIEFKLVPTTKLF